MERLCSQISDQMKRIYTALELLKQQRHSKVTPVKAFKMKQVAYYERQAVLADTSEWSDFPGGSYWGGKDLHCCFQADIVLSKGFKGKTAALSLRTGADNIWDTDNPQFLVYVNGELRCAMDMNHQEVVLAESALEDQHFNLGFYGYSNSNKPSMYFEVSYYVINKEVEDLYYDMKVPYDIAVCLREDSLERIKTVQILSETVNLLDLRRDSEGFFCSVSNALSYLHRNYYENLCGKQSVTVHSIGHTHIDVAWKWPLKQTREKVLRSFKTVLYLMERYPEYKFMSSQPQLYEFVKEDCPGVYEEIKHRIKEGRWETEGAMWLEADCNLIAGESFVRQILYGKKFFKEEFGKADNVVLWLPDVFGYSAALPQIMKKSGIRYFMTTKIAWNEYNRIPNDVMLWKGIDGSEILTYFITTRDYDTYPELNKKPNISTTYNGRQNASQVMGTWQRFGNKNLAQEVLTCYGFGDGGGGPTTEMLEESRRMGRGLPGCPMTKQTFIRDFFELLESDLRGKNIPKWCGELYLETHRGTYTSMARNKRYNRLCEFRNQDAELLNVIALVFDGSNPYPAEELEKAWKLTLLNQFHDILPGSSIKEVYEDSQEQYREVLNITEVLINRGLRGITDWLAEKADVSTVDIQADISSDNQDNESKELVIQENENKYNVLIDSESKNIGIQDTENITVGIQDIDNQDNNIQEAKNKIQIVQSIPIKLEEKIYTQDKCFLLVFNQLGFKRDSIINLPNAVSKTHNAYPYIIFADGEYLPVQKTEKGSYICRAKNIPSKGFLLLDAVPYTDNKIMNQENIINPKEIHLITIHEKEIHTPFYQIQLNDQGEIISLYDKEAERELLQKGKKANQLLVCDDRPSEYDAWNIDSTFREKFWTIDGKTSVTVTENGRVRTCIKIIRKYLNSVISQTMILYPDSRRIDFETIADWKESQQLLKAVFPMDIMTDKATYEIQYGNVERPTHTNTSWEEAKFEVCAHKWADISEADYGVAVLNDCKYGYDIHESVIGITLIKSGIYPNPEADKEVHILTYSLLPHLGDYRKGRVLQNAFDLNCPLYTREVNQLKTGSRKTWSLFSTDSENVILDTVKKAEASEDIILRIYEAYGRRSNTSIISPLLNSWEVTECNLMEEDIISSEIISPPEPANIIEFLNSAESICSAEHMSNANLKNVIEPINTKIISKANYINTAELISATELISAAEPRNTTEFLSTAELSSIEHKVKAKENKFFFTLKPFEIKTFRFKRQNPI